MIREQPVTAEELESAKAIYNGSFALGMEDPAVTASYALNILMNKLPGDFYSTYLQRINAVTANDIELAARKYFSFDHTRIVIVGNAAEFADKLKQLPYEVKSYDKLAKPVEN